MNLVHVSKLYYPEVGGIEWVVRRLAEETVGADNTVRVLSSVPRGTGGSDVVNGVRVSKASSLGVALSVPLAPTFPVHLRSAARSADLFHYHLPDPLSATSHVLAGPSGTPSVATYHNDIVRQSTALRAYRPVLDRFLAGVDRIIVTSPRLAEQSPFLAPFAEKCTVVPLGIDPEEYGSYDGPSFDLPTRPDRPLLLFVGRLIYYKGLEHLIDAMPAVDADLLIVGKGDRSEALERRAGENGVDDRVSFLGYVPERMLHYCYDRADVFVLPSVAASEGFGLVQLEAMAYRTPVVNTDLPTGVPWVSRDGETGVTVPPADPAALADGINRLLADRETRETYGKNARERVETEFRADRMIEGTHRVYERLLSE